VSAIGNVRSACRAFGLLSTMSGLLVGLLGLLLVISGLLVGFRVCYR
jgi:hypothetical protein